jgi:GntR family transcriptional regulator, carbon starvation induced regulator
MQGGNPGRSGRAKGVRVSTLLNMRPGAQRSSISSTTLARLRREILNGQIPPGERLNLDQLRATYSVSLSPLREALARLASEGLVRHVEEQRGFQVAPVSSENLNEVTALRKTLEVMALAQSIEHGDDEWESEIVSALHRLSKLRARSRADENAVDEEWEHWHRRFHAALIGACRAPVLMQFCDTLHDLSDRYRRVFMHLRQRSPRDVHAEHTAIAEAALRREPDTACGLMARHIEVTATQILAVLPQDLRGG